MNTNRDRSPTRDALRATLLGAAFLGLLASRRWQQVVMPQVWCEDAWILAGFIKSGWHDFFMPLNGYLVLVPKLITYLSLKVSLYHYPFVSTVLAFAFTLLVGLAVVFSPVRLSARALCALSIFAIPSDSEVFGLPLYTLWWSAVLLIVCALWDERVPARFIRSVYVFVGGLSSPFVFVALPVFYYRAYWYRASRAERTVAIVASVVAAIQLPFVVLGAAKTLPAVSSILKSVIPKFCGWFVLGNFSQEGALLWTAGLCVICLSAQFLIRNRREPSAWILVYLYVGAIGSSIARVDPSVLAPSGAGPRYFFLPFALTFWILIQLCISTAPGWLRLSSATLALVALMNAVPVWSRGHSDMHWTDNLLSSRLFPSYWIKAQYDGSPNSGFFTVATGDAWDAAIKSDAFVSPSKLRSQATFAYRIVDRNEVDAADVPSIPSSRIEVGNHAAVLRLRAGERVRFRSGNVAHCQIMEIVGLEGTFIPRLPITSDWVTLEFSNSRLPHEFTLRVVDQGQGFGEWSPTENSF